MLFFSTNPTPFSLFWIGFPVLILVFFVLIFILQKSKKPFKAADGTVFANEEDLKSYEIAFEKISNILERSIDDMEDQKNEGLDILFIDKLRNKGFKNVTEIMQNRKNFNILVNILFDK
tara:strand:- start:627 stop:983 length:357 start_codon:yes stop_codon:yes gene_type:complete